MAGPSVTDIELVLSDPGAKTCAYQTTSTPYGRSMAGPGWEIRPNRTPDGEDIYPFNGTWTATSTTRW